MKSIFVVTHDGSQSVQIVRWNGPAGDFDYVAQTQGPGISDGDTLKAEIIGTTIRVYINGALVLTGSDSTFATGNPGIGFYLQGGPSETNSDFGFSSITATGGKPSWTRRSNAHADTGSESDADASFNAGAPAVE